MLAAPARSPSPFVAVVRRGEAFLFAALDACITDSSVQLVWDRRWGERRRHHAEHQSGERRAGERRGPLPPSWTWPGLAIVEASRSVPPRPRILLVDDDARVRDVLQQALAMAGYDVVAAADGEEALAAYAAAPADLVITDIMMPRKDGVDTIRGLRARHPVPKVIAVTAARGRFNRMTAARHVGAQHTLLKPFGMSDLLTAVRDVLAR
jgi:CheY-like chemotaxis protein